VAQWNSLGDPVENLGDARVEVGSISGKYLCLQQNASKGGGPPAKVYFMIMVIEVNPVVQSL
jgi:hypothetical protein